MSADVFRPTRRHPAALLLALAASILAITTPQTARAQDQQSNHAAAFLRAGVDARHLALGGVGAGLANDIAAGYWNPAGLAILRGWSATGMATQGLNFDRHHNYVAAAYGTAHGTLALSWINASTSNLAGADASGASTGSFDFGENAVILSGALGSPTANVGASAKLLTQSLGTTAPGGADDQALGYSFDFGAQYIVTSFARAGFVLQDLFGHLGSEKTANVNDVPATARFGLSLEPVTGLTVAADLVKVRDEDGLAFRMGGEVLVPLGNSTSGAFRLGIRDGKFTGGVGFTVSRLTFDYAYVVEREAFLDENHRFSLTIDLGGHRRVVTEGSNLGTPKVGDRDGDGFPDDQDKCPDLAEDFDSFQDFDGCPDLDNDNDGIPDVDDLCPDEPETKNGYQDDDGCPDTVPGAQVQSTQPATAATPLVFPPARIPFASGKSDIPPGSTGALDEVVRMLKDNPTVKIEIQGHTDNVGDDVLNLRLSMERAEAVKRYLVEQGIAADRLVARGYGESRPTAGNGTAGGRTANRRIEFVPLAP
jgi:outer membrane protein OmpA-like peptidoglycan-associated protein